MITRVLPTLFRYSDHKISLLDINLLPRSKCWIIVRVSHRAITHNLRIFRTTPLKIYLSL